MDSKRDPHTSETVKQLKMKFVFPPPQKPGKQLIVRAVANSFRVSDQLAHEWLLETFGGTK